MTEEASESDPSRSSPSVTAVIVAYNSAAVLPGCLESLKAEGLRIVVVDNASGDATAQLSKDAGAQVIVNDANQGFGRAANQGIAEVGSEFALLVNPDVEFPVGTVGALLEAARRYPDAALLAPRLVEADGRVFFQARSFLSRILTNPEGLRREPEGDCCTPFLSGAVLLIRMEAWRALGGFDPRIFLFYEDDDLCRRAADAGWSLVHVHAAEARHLRGASNPQSPANAYRRRWHLAWSRGYVARKYALPGGLAGVLAVNAAKWLGAALLGKAERRARYAGSLAGAWAYLTGRSALEKEGLE